MPPVVTINTKPKGKCQHYYLNMSQYMSVFVNAQKEALVQHYSSLGGWAGIDPLMSKVLCLVAASFVALMGLSQTSCGDFQTHLLNISSFLAHATYVS